MTQPLTNFKGYSMVFVNSKGLKRIKFRKPKKAILGKTFRRNNLRPGWNPDYIPLDIDTLTITQTYGLIVGAYMSTDNWAVCYYHLRRYYVEV